VTAVHASRDDKEKRTHESLGNDEEVALGVTLVDRVIYTKDQIPDLNDSVVTRGVPRLQRARGI
jgi:hypothetical protein